MQLSLFKRMKKKKINEKKVRDDALMENTELLLEGLIRSVLKSNPIIIFSEVELQDATNNYHSDTFLYSDDASYDFFKGIHEDRVILVKKFKGRVWNGHIKRSISEIVALSHINHKFMVKLLGCCLETQCPIQVYEFCFNKNLSDCIHTQCPIQEIGNDAEFLSWENRLNIASEIAVAVTYLHTANSRPTIHRDIRSRNVILDQNYVAKLFDLSISIAIPVGQTHVEAEIAGTMGFIAPDCIETGKVSEKSDVFSFGMLLLELLTGNRPFNLANLAQEEVLRLSDYVKSVVSTENRLREIVEPKVWKGGVSGMISKQLQEFSKLAVRCIEPLEEERPTMLEVAKELRRIKSYA